jgi:DNA-binding MarR family transcriptional regulator
MEVTSRESEILGLLDEGVNSPTTLARRLGITQSGATQALQKLEKKGLVARTKVGRNVRYDPLRAEEPEKAAELEEDLDLLLESYHALSKVWSHLLRLDLSQDELRKVREARNLLEEILTRRGKSLE